MKCLCHIASLLRPLFSLRFYRGREHAASMKRTYHNVKQLLKMINYSKYLADMCYLEVVSQLMGLRIQRYTIYCYFLCIWDRRTIALHYIKRGWPQRASFKHEEMNLEHPLFSEPYKIIIIIIPPFHTKFWPCENFGKSHG